MKKLLLCALLCMAADARALVWNVKSGLQATLDIYSDRIYVSAQSDDQSSLCERDIVIIQNGRQMTVSADARQLDADTARIVYRTGYEGCSTLYPGAVAEAVIDQFPGWFDLAQAFTVIYVLPYGDLSTLDIPAAARPAMAPLPDETPDNASCEQLRWRTLLGLPTRNKFRLCAWTGEYMNRQAVFFNALVLQGTGEINSSAISITQGELQASGLSFWADNRTTAVLECPKCDTTVMLGRSICGAMYDVPAWFDWSQPFTLTVDTYDIAMNTPQDQCAASFVLGPGHPGLAALRSFRDHWLGRSAAGRLLVDFYYRHSGRLTALLGRSPRLRAAVKAALERLASIM